MKDGYYIVESLQPYTHSDGSISEHHPIERTIIEWRYGYVSWLGGDCPSELDELLLSWKIIREIDIETP